MTLNSINCKQRMSTNCDRRQQLRQELHACRQGTLSLFEGIDYATFCHQAHPDFSPVGWHLGHIAFIESLWLLERSAKIPRLFPEFGSLFVADGLPKTKRRELPTFSQIYDYLDTVRSKVLHRLESIDLDCEERLWRWIIQHESQHCETIAIVLQLQRQNPAFSIHDNTSDLREMIEIPAGYFAQGSNSLAALDNERPMHQVKLDTYWIDRYPVTCGQYRDFIAAGGYRHPQWWSNAGWEWLQTAQVTQPLYWLDSKSDNHPVYGVSWYEAEAYAQFVGKRLPTEAEWEKAASWDAKSGCHRIYPWGDTLPDRYRCNHDNFQRQTTPVDTFPTGQSAYGCYDLLGNVWEWTASTFEGYEGFTSYPYIGYSQAYFDGQHRVLKGGSWATRQWALRCSFRSWYYPGVRQIFAGFRCAQGRS